MTQTEQITERYHMIRSRVAQACERAGREPDDVTIIGVTKKKPASVIISAAEAGILDVGENYVQEMAAKHEEVRVVVNWHYIGHLQRNKVKYIAPFVHAIHAVDSERLAREINKQARTAQRTIPVLLQVNTSGEDSKFGVAPEDALSLAEKLLTFPNIELHGLMTLAAFLDDPEEVRPMFCLLRETRDSIQLQTGHPLPHLSMGMTNDFEVAIEEGATMVRIGTALFGSRE